MNILSIWVGPVSVDLIGDDRICLKLPENGFEPESLSAWSRIVKPGAEAIDVGSYSGLYAIAAAKLGAQVTAVEPMPTHVARIRDNAMINRVVIGVEEAAASDNNGTARLDFNVKVPFTSGASLLPRKLHNSSMNVRTLRLDDLPTSNVKAIKIDVECAELLVLRGARNLLSRDRPMLIIEALGDEEKNAVKEFLSDYRLVSVLDRRNLLLEPAECHG